MNLSFAIPAIKSAFIFRTKPRERMLTTTASVAVDPLNVGVGVGEGRVKKAEIYQPWMMGIV